MNSYIFNNISNAWKASFTALVTRGRDERKSIDVLLVDRHNSLAATYFRHYVLNCGDSLAMGGMLVHTSSHWKARAPPCKHLGNFCSLWCYTLLKIIDGMITMTHWILEIIASQKGFFHVWKSYRLINSTENVAKCLVNIWCWFF